MGFAVVEPYIQFNSDCCNVCIFTARAKILVRNENEREKNKSNNKTTAKPKPKTNKSKHFKKTPWLLMKKIVQENSVSN